MGLWRVSFVARGADRLTPPPDSIFYPTTEKFREAWNSPDLVKYKLNLPGNWIGSDRVYVDDLTFDFILKLHDKVGDFLPGDNIAPPLAIQPSVMYPTLGLRKPQSYKGQHFSVDETQKYESMIQTQQLRLKD
jgi:hypothetical protein